MQTSKYNITYNMNIFTWFERLLFGLWSENCWNICHDLQAFIMNELLVCMSFKYQYSLFANKRIIFKLEEIIYKCRTRPPRKRGKSSTKEKNCKNRKSTLGETAISPWLRVTGTYIGAHNYRDKIINLEFWFKLHDFMTMHNQIILVRIVLYLLGESSLSSCCRYQR